MKHPSQEELILHYYSEAADLLAVEHHLAACEECRAVYRSVAGTLDGMNAFSAPERSQGYEAQVWARLRAALPERSRLSFWMLPWWWAAAGAGLAALLIAAFLAGRSYPPPHGPVGLASSSPAGERVLRVAVGDHLERSQMVLSELANTDSAGPLDITFEQERAANLLDENRLYRQTAVGAGDAALAGVLDELERILMEIEHAPAQISPAELDELRLRLQAEGILFKLRVLGSNVRRAEQPATRRPL